MMKILVVDDHPLVRQGLISLLSLEQDFECVGEACNIAEALKIIEKQKPEIVLVDLRLGNDSGLDLLKQLKGTGLKFIVLTSSARETDFQLAKNLGADGYVLKEALPDELLYAIRLVSNGRKYYDPGVLEMMISSGERNEHNLLRDLTPKELEVLRTLGLGLSNREIAQKLYVTEHTVKKHVSQILDKLCLTDRTQAALYANVKGLSHYKVS